MKRIVCFLLLAVMLVTLMSGCAAQRDVRQLLTEFENACHEKDVETMLKCIDPKISDSVRVMFGVIGGFSDANSQKIMEYVSSFLLKEGTGGEELFTSLKIEPKQIKKDKETATVSAIVTYQMAGEEIRKEANIECIYYAERWYISGYSVQ